MSIIVSHSPLNIESRQKDRTKGPPINGLWRAEWSRDRWCHMTLNFDHLKGQGHDPQYAYEAKTGSILLFSNNRKLR